METQHEIKEQAKQNFMNTDYALKIYNQMHPDEPLRTPSKPKFSDLYKPSVLKKQGELIFVSTGALALGYAAFRFLLLPCELTKLYLASCLLAFFAQENRFF